MSASEDSFEKLMKTCPPHEHPPLPSIPEPMTVQEKAQAYGTTGLAEAELLCLLGLSHEQSAAIMAKAGELAKLYTWTANDFMKVPGLGPRKAWALVGLLDLAKRSLRSEAKPLLNEPSALASYLQPMAAGLEVEKCWVLSLNRRNRLICCTEVSSGTATASLLHPREVFREALRVSASAVVVSHNHPSGDPQPSAADISVTRQLKESARILGIDLLDHVIIGRAACDPSGKGWYSFRNVGLC